MADTEAAEAVSGAVCSSEACSAAEGITIITAGPRPEVLAASAEEAVSEALAAAVVPAAAERAAAVASEAEAASAEAAVPAEAEPAGADSAETITM